MDLLQDILRQAGLRSRLLGFRALGTSVSLQFPCNKSIGFHVVTQGTAFLHLNKKAKPLQLNKGDIALMARGQDHIVSTSEEVNAKVTSLFEFEKLPSASSKVKLSLISGAYQVWNTPMHPLFSELPDWFILRADDLQSFESLQTMIALLAEETAKPKLGTEKVVQNILDIMFYMILRRVVEKNSSKSATWSHAIQDEQIKKSIELMHSDLSHAWTIEELAAEVGLSRAGFAMKFKKALGDTPVHYLTMLRVQKAMDILSSSDNKIEAVAEQVGYQDAFGFSKAFKKFSGVSPRDFRSKDLEDKKLSWRF